MSRSAQPSGPTHVPVWVMRFNEAFDRVFLIVRVNIVWTLLTLLGLVVLGIAPASAAAADALIAARHGAKVAVLRTMWASYRAQLVTANTRMLPLMVVQLGSASMLWLAVGGAAPSAPMTTVLAGLAVISLAWSTLSTAVVTAVPRVRRQDLPVSYRLAILLPGAMPGRFIALILGLGVWVALCSFLWPLALLLGAATAIDYATSLLGRRTELLLEDLDRSRAATL